MVRGGSPLYFTDEGQVCGHNVAALAGSVEEADLKKYNATCPPGRAMDIRVFPTNPEILEQIRKGSVEVVFLDWGLVAVTIQKEPGQFQVASPVLTGEAPGQPRHRDGIVVRKGDTAMLSGLQQALAAVIQNGTYQRLLAKYGLQDGDIRTAK